MFGKSCQETGIFDESYSVFVNEDSSFEPVTVRDCTDVFSIARHCLSCEYVSVVFPKHLPRGFCLLVDDDAAQSGRGVSAIGTYLFGHYMESVPLYGPFLVAKYDDTDAKRKTFSFLSKEESEHIVTCFEEQILPHIKDALEALIRKKKKEKFRII